MNGIARIKTKTPSPYKLTHIEVDTHDTKTFRFELRADATLDMLPGDFLYIHTTINGKHVKRPYTPSSLVGTTGFFDLTVKRYAAGSVSRYLHDQLIGDTVLMSGPNTGGSGNATSKTIRTFIATTSWNSRLPGGKVA
ncbi:MAG TPA: FAD-binding oxidoreductase [Nitrospira sp.]|nr:FAD-binding oxidoreductase [Nitrospira sp.]